MPTLHLIEWRLVRSVRRFVAILRDTVGAFLEDDAGLLGAAMVYYALLSLGPLLLILISALGLGASSPAGTDARARFIHLTQGYLGPEFANTLTPILRSVSRRSVTITGIGLVVLIYAAMGSFRHLRKSFRRIWTVEKPVVLPIRKAVLHEVIDSLAAFVLVVAAGLLMLLSTIGTSLVAAVRAQVLQVPLVGSQLSPLVSPFASFLVGFLIFSALYRFLPPVKVRWRDVWLGALLAAALWESLKRLLAFYLTQFAVGSTYGLVGTVVVMMIWVYATCLVVFLGAEFCKVWAHRNAEASEVA
jgi:membrane protein